MATARKVVESLVARGMIPVEFEESAVEELHREMTRRSRRLVQTLAALTELHGLATAYAGGSR